MRLEPLIAKIIYIDERSEGRDKVYSTIKMQNRNVPKATLQMYTVYLKALRKLQKNGVERIMSKELSSFVDIEPTTIRRDFSFLGNLGKQGYGYDVDKLIEIFNSQLGVDFDEKIILFGAWFCFFAKDILPTYYDANKINYVSQGIFRIHLVGLSFNNGNWIYICTTLKIWTLATVVLYPLAGIIIINCFNIALWDILNKIFLIMILGGMVVSIYIIGKKYE